MKDHGYFVRGIVTAPLRTNERGYGTLYVLPLGERQPASINDKADKFGALATAQPGEEVLLQVYPRTSKFGLQWGLKAVLLDGVQED